ncbi:MAG TPA: pH regulation protein F [Euryarchaeota archaeon]|nr:pH regulation protein F [Staphylothermus sp.]RLG89194.1 MAG: pH regulation protein F [Thermoprotei archaeon]HEC96413.1 pH regulation protein F [Euryarchaeota archaeon]
MSLEQQVITFILYVFPFYLFAFTLYIVRALKGPTIPDTVLAIDALSFDIAAFLALLSIIYRSPILVACTIVLALWVYALDIYVSKYFTHKELGE